VGGKFRDGDSGAALKVAVAIPARFGSTRLPGKMLIEVGGKPLVRHVWEKARGSKLASEVVVVTDDERVQGAAIGFGARAEMTSAEHRSGTDRIAELVVSGRLEAAIVVNVQGDEPEIDPDHIDAAAGLLVDDQGADVATLASPVASMEEYGDPNAVKVVVGGDGFALYFSRAPVPFVRDGLGEEPDFGKVGIYRHIGLYAYRREALVRWADAAPSRLEGLEKLEQLRALEIGLRIKVAIVGSAPAGIDTEEDLRAFRERIESQDGSERE
jgi:3-deoxy-manno-octulosonate cytidylyltransferase (CMP-KDO synthetase)